VIDPELKEHLNAIQSELVLMRKRTTNVPHALLRGMVYGAGYIIGTVLILVIIGWVLNVVGVIPMLSRYVSEFRVTLENVGRTLK
jgi:hypothetical protein